MKYLKLEESTSRGVRVSHILLNCVTVSRVATNFDPKDCNHYFYAGNFPPRLSPMLPESSLDKIINLSAEKPGPVKPLKKRKPGSDKVIEKEMTKISNKLADEIYSMIAALKESPPKNLKFGATKHDCGKVAKIIEDRIAELGKIKVYRRRSYMTEGWKFLTSLYRSALGSVSRLISVDGDNMNTVARESLVEEAKSSATAIVHYLYKVSKKRSKTGKKILIRKIASGTNELPLGIAIGKATLLALHDLIGNVDNKDNGGVLGHIASTCLESVRIAFSRDKYLGEIYGNVLKEMKFNQLPARHGFLMRLFRAKADSARGINLARNVVDLGKPADANYVYVVAELALLNPGQTRETILGAWRDGKTVRIATLKTNGAGEPTGEVHVDQSDELVVYARSQIDDYITKLYEEQQITDVEDICTLEVDKSVIF